SKFCAFLLRMNRRRTVMVVAAAVLVVGVALLFARPWEVSSQDRKILDEKKALAAEYVAIVQGRGRPDEYLEHYSQFLREIGEDPAKLLPILTPTTAISMPAIPTPVPTGMPPIPIFPTSTPTVVSVPMTVAWGSQLKVDRVPVAVDEGHVFVLDTL